MVSEQPHPRESRDALTVPPQTWQCNAHSGIGSEGPTPSHPGGWRHPSIQAALISAAATVIGAIVSVVLVKVL